MTRGACLHTRHAALAQQASPGRPAPRLIPVETNEHVSSLVRFFLFSKKKKKKTKANTKKEKKNRAPPPFFYYYYYYLFRVFDVL
jgi:hypothetical protein